MMLNKALWTFGVLFMIAGAAAVAAHCRACDEAGLSRGFTPTVHLLFALTWVSLAWLSRRLARAQRTSDAGEQQREVEQVLRKASRAAGSSWSASIHRIPERPPPTYRECLALLRAVLGVVSEPQGPRVHRIRDIQTSPDALCESLAQVFGGGESSSSAAKVWEIGL